MTLDTSDVTYNELINGYTLNLTARDTCTSRAVDLAAGTSFNDACTITSNSTLGTIINPVRSARLSTRGKKTIKYGRVEVVAKMPKGDWIWPAIW